MAKFHYRAIDAQGKPAEGEMTALDLSQLEQRLQDMGLWLVRALEAKPKTSSPIGKRGKVKPRDLLEFSTHMFTLLDAGIPLSQAVSNLAKESPNLQLRSTLHAVFQQVEAGSPLAAAMKQHPNVFPPQVTNLIQAGEESDTLADTFKELERYLDWAEQIRGDVRQATIYPSIVIFAVTGLLILLFTFVIPRFIPVLHDLHVPLPFVTVLVIGVSEFMVHNWMVWMPILLMTPLAWWVGRNYVTGFSSWRDRIILQLPVVGELLRMLTLSKFVQNFAVLYRAGIPVLQCLELCRGLVGNRVVSDALQNVQRSIAEGSTIHESLQRYPIFPPMMIQMISVGETTGNLPKTLMNVANYYNREIPRRVKKIFGILEPVITLGLIGIVGIVALALFMPMMSLMGGIK
ncbi:MAG: type II secretion system F family protein [Nitrospirota bacterium]|nr:type II secretion system F family protein [Nitrospirota bacterium]